MGQGKFEERYKNDARRAADFVALLQEDSEAAVSTRSNLESAQANP